MKQENQEFIGWAKRQTQDKDFWGNFTQTVMIRYEKWVIKNHKLAKGKLIKKLYKGSVEHGSPLKYTKRQLSTELEAEYLDLWGWQLVELYLNSLGKFGKRSNRTANKRDKR